jgi:hypothetical protein
MMNSEKSETSLTFPAPEFFNTNAELFMDSIFDHEEVEKRIIICLGRTL